MDGADDDDFDAIFNEGVAERAAGQAGTALSSDDAAAAAASHASPAVAVAAAADSLRLGRDKYMRPRQLLKQPGFWPTRFNAFSRVPSSASSASSSAAAAGEVAGPTQAKREGCEEAGDRHENHEALQQSSYPQRHYAFPPRLVTEDEAARVASGTLQLKALVTCVDLSGFVSGSRFCDLIAG